MSTDVDAAKSSVPYGAAIYLAVVQFFFAGTWIVYVIFLPGLCEAAGVGRAAVVWILLVDQAVFAAVDLTMGVWADRVRGALRRLGPVIVAISAVSCLAFLLLPHVAALGRSGTFGAPVAGGILILAWAVTSSALRVPPWVLLSRYAAKPAMPWLSALTLSGMAISGAVSPYLGTVLTGVDPRLPFAISALTLLATTAGLIRVERLVALHESDPAPRPSAAAARDRDPTPVMFFVGCAVLAFGFQIHFFLNSSGQYLRFAKPADLGYLMPVFWVGFNLLMFPGAAVAGRFGALIVMAASAVSGLIGMTVVALAGNLVMMIIGHFLVGGAWGCAMMAAFAGAMAFGRNGREGAMIGVLSALLAVAACARIALVATDAAKLPLLKSLLAWLPPSLWLIGAVALLAATTMAPREVRPAAGRA